jgi:hypothetical protein
MDVHTSLVLLALTSALTTNAAVPSPTWNKDYAQVLKQGQKENKPVIVVVSAGEKGWDKLSHEGRLPDEANRLLADHYVCLYVDKATDPGRRLAREFDIADDVAVIISDGTGKLQAFRHEGDLANPDLSHYLKRYADPDRVVVTTETNPAEPARVRYSQPAPSIDWSNCAT